MADRASCVPRTPRARVHSLTVEPIGTGQTGASFRLHLDGDGGCPEHPGRPRPPPVIGPPRERVAAGYRNEVGFYTVFRDRVRIRTPRCWHAEISEDLCSFVLLLDDLAPARPGVQADGCTVDQAVDAVRNLAGLHAPVWNDPSLYDQRDWLTAMIGQRAAFLGGITEGAGRAVPGALYGPELGDDADTLRRRPRSPGAGGDRHGVAGLVHGDYRLDNLMFPEHGDGVVTARLADALDRPAGARPRVLPRHQRPGRRPARARARRWSPSTSTSSAHRGRATTRSSGASPTTGSACSRAR